MAAHGNGPKKASQRNENGSWALFDRLTPADPAPTSAGGPWGSPEAYTTGWALVGSKVRLERLLEKNFRRFTTETRRSMSRSVRSHAGLLIVI